MEALEFFFVIFSAFQGNWIKGTIKNVDQALAPVSE